MTHLQYRTACMTLALVGWLGLPGHASAPPGAPQPQTQQPDKPKYSRDEYDALQAATAEKNPQQRLKVLDGIVAKYPNSELLIYFYQQYVRSYQETRAWPKVVEYFDKILSFPNLEQGARLNAMFQRSQTVEFAYNAKDANAKEQLTKARDVAREGLKGLNDFAKPAGATDEQFAAAKKLYSTQFRNTEGFASLELKDNAAAIEAFKASLAIDSTQALTAYRLGRAYLQKDPPAFLDGFWALARSISLKIPNDAAIRKYLRQQMTNYQLLGCDSLVDAEMKELIALSASSGERPATYSLPSRADLDKVLQQSTIVTVLADLKAGGDKGKLTWLAVCSGEFPEALGKVYEVTPGADSLVIKAAIGTTEDEVKAATAPNAELKVVGQPEAARLEKDGLFRFGGALVDYTPDPFFLHWDKVKVNGEDIPAEKTPAKKAGKAPGKRPPKKKSP